MKNILAFGASTSTTSINQKLAKYAADCIKDVNINLLDLNMYEMLMYSSDRQAAYGIPEAAKHFKKLIKSSDGIIISFAEHNASYTAAFKNLFDWTSVIEKSIWNGKPMFLLATSPGGRGGQTVLDTAVSSFGFMDGKVISNFALPSFQNNFDTQKGITDIELKKAFDKECDLFQKAI